MSTFRGRIPNKRAGVGWRDGASTGSHVMHATVGWCTELPMFVVTPWWAICVVGGVVVVPALNLPYRTEVVMEFPIGASATPSDAVRAIAHMISIVCAYVYTAGSGRYDWECVLCILYPCFIQVEGWVRTKGIRAHEYRHGHTSVEVAKWAVMSTAAIVFVVYWAGTLDQTSDAATYALIMYVGSVVASSEQSRVRLKQKAT